MDRRLLNRSLLLFCVTLKNNNFRVVKMFFVSLLPKYNTKYFVKEIDDETAFTDIVHLVEKIDMIIMSVTADMIVETGTS